MTQQAEIRFGTDGWRALIAEDYTYANVARCAQGLCDYMKRRGTAERGLIVGYDTRFLSPEFAATVAGVAASQGVRTMLADKSAPTPVLSYNVLHHGAGGAAIITASHNPATWNGFKFKPEYAGSATQEITDDLEKAIREVDAIDTAKISAGRNSGLVEDFKPSGPYFDHVARLVDLDAIRSAGFRVVVDAMYGAGAGYLPHLLEGGATIVEELHGYRNPAFPGMAQPEPIAPNLAELLTRVPASGASVGIALDGDADRVGIIDEGGRFVTTLDTFSLLALYLLEVKGWRGSLIKGVTASQALNKMGNIYGVYVHEVQVGFKHMGPRMDELNALMAGEESGGFAFRGHVPERDGILSGLYVLEYMAKTGKTVSELLENLFHLVGPHFYHRRDIEFDANDRERIRELVNNPVLDRLGDFPVVSSDSIDGRRLHFDDGWLGVRFSGTEPLLRIYAEASSPERVTGLLDAAQEYLGV
ncbi:MAG: phosphoglucomutase/phosphomannomutase family protein [Chloroflexi bacterium]|nr:phosphoglucomutase/phosphomannomutase family protein [Chloroflexota bacterium]